MPPNLYGKKAVLHSLPPQRPPMTDSPISPDHIAAAEALLDLEFTPALHFDADAV